MKPSIKKAWIEALRSGEYAQTRGSLRDESGFCCLGVLCDVAVDGNWEEQPHGSWLPPKSVRLRNKDDGHMSPEAYKRLGLDDWIRLALLNDEGSSFLEIADYIEENV